MELATLDLNLLVSLRALLEERSVSRAAARVGVGQPAMSTQLARLRRHFGDELLARSGNSYVLTPLATQLLERAEVAYTSLQRVFAARQVFDPATSDREFQVAMSDYTVTVLGGPLAAVMSRTSPHVRLHIEPITAGFAASPDLHRTVDALVLPHGLLDRQPHQDLYRDEWVCVIDARNPSVGEQLTVDQLGELPWVLSYGRSSNPALSQMRLHGVEPRAVVCVDSFVTVPCMVVGTDRVAVVQRRIAEAARKADHRLRVLPFPFDLEPTVEALWWHEMYDADVGHRWLRSVFAEAGAMASGPEVQRVRPFLQRT